MLSDDGDVSFETYDVGAFRELMTDVRRSFDMELSALEVQRERAWRTIQFNGLMATIIVGVLTIIELPDAKVALIALAIGGVLIGYSTLVSFEARLPTDFDAGPSTRTIQEMQSNRYSEVEYLGVFSQRMMGWRNDVAKTTDERITMVVKSMRASLGGVGFLLVGLLLGVTL